MRIPTTTRATAGNHGFFAIFNEVGNNRITALDDGSWWDENHPIFTILARALIWTAIGTVLGCPELVVAIVRERRAIMARTDDDITATTTVAAIWATLGIKASTMKRDPAITAASRLNIH